jgi:signal transduction histidine kinase
MHALATINAFLEDTGLLTATAYLLARGRMLTCFFERHIPTVEMVRIGVILGAIGLTEVVFPGDRYPYITDTLMTTLAVMMGGARIGLVCALVISAGAIFLQSWQDWLLTTTAVFLVVLVCRPLRQFDGLRYSPWYGMAAGMVSEGVVLAAQYGYSTIIRIHPYLVGSVRTILANGFAMMLMTMVINDAWIRVNSERNRLDAERYKLLASKAQLAALRARIHPHFLYNALTSIAGMCDISSLAQQTTIRLGDLMRSTLEASAVNVVSLSVEMERVGSYLDIEQQRFGERLSIQVDIDSSCGDVRVPPFSLQTLVENAINHGVSSAAGPRTITISARRRRGHALLAVHDNGNGMPESIRREISAQNDQAVHGTQILSSQLTILFGRPARLRIFSRLDVGTLAAFAVPVEKN